MTSVPPRRSARSRMDFRPRCPGKAPEGSKPTPSSRISSETPSGTVFTLRSTLVAPECLTALCMGLLGDAIERFLALRRYVGLLAKVGAHVDPVPGLYGRRPLLKRADEALGLQRLRPELEDEGAHLG